MTTYEELDEEELSHHIIQRSIEESCLSSCDVICGCLTQLCFSLQPPGDRLTHTAGEQGPGGPGPGAAGGETALTLAVSAGLLENVRRLLDLGASPLHSNSRNETPLLLAVRAGSSQMTSVLTSGGAWVDQPCHRKWTALHEAARGGRVDVLMLLLRSGARVNQQTSMGMTPLAVAAEQGHAHIAEILLNCGSRVNSQALNGESVLMEAAGAGNPACVRVLLENGADPNLPSITGHLPIHKAAFTGHYQVLQMLIPLTSSKCIKATGQSPLHSAAEGGHNRCLQLLLASGSDVNYCMSARNSQNYRDMRRSALYYAVSNGDAACTGTLLEAGARADLDPLRCLLVAVRSGRYDLTQLLLDRRADVNCYFRVVSDTVFPTALQYCVKDAAMMRLLLNHGYDAQRCFHCHHGDDDHDNLAAGRNHDDNGYRTQRSGHRDREHAGDPRWCDCCDHDNPPHAGDHGNRVIPFCEFMGLCCLVHLSGRVVRILLDYVHHVSICPKLRRILQEQRDWSDICSILRSPRSLSHICRLEIRRRLTLKRLNNPEVMNSDLFPPRLRDYLLYRELEPQRQFRY
ncbi:Ankyrin repeat and SOCS box protein 15 [Merluccius polli]|uniref:Ankyrin repeat and SOCS box protein 15 n=1 Tax=Merluccius polli TaxID=89951 RepID=A0AA47MK41_MERPO|nr:Ankyrin repeat and SOCS box protein 15 [Merluccius polli]